MTVSNATPHRGLHGAPCPCGPARSGSRSGLLTAFSAVACRAGARACSHGRSPRIAPMPRASIRPSSCPARIAVSNIDFKRGDGGAGRLILRFSGAGAAAGPAQRRSTGRHRRRQRPAAGNPAKPLDVTDFATPVQRIDARAERRRHPAGAEHQRRLRVDGLPDRQRVRRRDRAACGAARRRGRRQRDGRRPASPAPAPRLQRHARSPSTSRTCRCARCCS